MRHETNCQRMCYCNTAACQKEIRWQTMRHNKTLCSVWMSTDQPCNTFCRDKTIHAIVAGQCIQDSCVISDCQVPNGDAVLTWMQS